MTRSELLEALMRFERAGLVLKLADGRLVGPKVMLPEERAFVADYRDEFIALLNGAVEIPCPGDACEEIIRTIDGIGWCPKHRMTVRIVSEEQANA